MNFDLHSHVAARTHRHGLQTKQYAPSKGYRNDGGPKAPCDKCGRSHYISAMKYGACLECRITGAK